MSSDFMSDIDRREKNLKRLVEIFFEIKEKSYDIVPEEKRRELFKDQCEATYRTLTSINTEKTFEDYLTENNLI